MDKKCYGLAAAKFIHDHEPLPSSDRLTLLANSDDQPVAVLRYASVEVTQPGLVTCQHPLNEGEGHKRRMNWHEAHKSFWTSKSVLQVLNGPDFKSITEPRLCWRVLCRSDGHELKAQRQSTTFAIWVTLHRRAMSCHRV
ncbi:MULTISPECIES: ASCH domain-containing protein [Bifidobacterium]|uniref:ASCH domain-containing protein n=1 Tax=Bifidobacterium TaxID=1678 RepID=UPI0012DF737D